MKQYKSLDFAKFICAILIIILHTEPLSTYSSLATFGLRNIVTIIAVPFFFFTSGFLAFKKIGTLSEDKKNPYMVQYLKRVAIMYCIWSVVYLPFVVIKWVREGFSVFSVIEYIRDFFFEGSYSTIWFLPALFTAVLLTYLLHKKLTYRTIFIIACVIYIFTLGGSSYFGLVTQIPLIKNIYEGYYLVFDSIKNGVCFGLLFVSLGATFSEKEETVIQKVTPGKAFLPVCLFAVMIALEAFAVAYFDWNGKGVDTLITLVPFSYYFARFLLVWDVKISDDICVLMRKYSILMFLTQRLPMSILDVFLSETILVQNSILYFVTVFVVTIGVSFVILQASKKFKWIRFAY